MAWLLFLISPLLIAAKVVKSKHTVHHRSLQKHTVHHRSLQRQFLHGKIAHQKNHLKNHLRHKDIWKTNKHYPFPKWSPSGKQDGDPDDGHSGRCFLGIIPDIKMKQSEGQITMGKAVKKSFFKFLAFGNNDLKGRGVECKLDEQCTEVVDHSCLKNTVGLTEFPGMTTKALCYRDKGQNTCLCGIVRFYCCYFLLLFFVCSPYCIVLIRYFYYFLPACRLLIPFLSFQMYFVFFFCRSRP